MRTLATTLLLLALPAVAQPVDVSVYQSPQKLVAVEGARRLNLYCVGKGSPTVLFDSGLATSMQTWWRVQGEIGKTTRACAYDRAGFGFSDPPRASSDAAQAVADIHALLIAAKIRTPILYVGHSMAGLYGVLLQATHPGDVAGEVLVDPSFADQFDRLTAASVAAGAPPASGEMLLKAFRAQTKRLRECATLSAPLPADCVQVSRQLPPDLVAFETAQESRPTYLLASAAENEAFLSMPDGNVDQKQLEAVHLDFGDKPLVILTAGKGVSYPGLTREQNAAIDAAWKAGHDRLAALSTRGSNTVVPDSAHNIQRDQPQAVIDAINKALAEIRGR